MPITNTHQSKGHTPDGPFYHRTVTDMVTLLPGYRYLPVPSVPAMNTSCDTGHAIQAKEQVELSYNAL